MTATTAPGSPTSGAAGHRGRILAAFCTALMGLLVFSGAATTDGPTTVGECVGGGEVWLHVETETGQVLRSECVGTPTTGRAALAAAEVATTQSTGGYLCTLAGHPETCPRRFTGQSWHYFHAASPRASWVHSKKGAGGRRPPAGSIEGWCYNAEDEKECEPPRLTADHATADRVDIEPSDDGLDLWVVGLVLAAIVAAGFIVRRVGAR